MTPRHQPRKRFGQHFLHDPGVIRRIVAAIGAAPGQRLVEIGPGEGAITRALVEAAGALDVVEIDRDLAARLPAEIGHPGLRVHCADALRFDFRTLATGGRLRLVGNLPYNVSTPLLFHLLDCADAVEDMHFMLQKEVVDRMGAAPGDDAYGRLSVMLQYRCRVERLFTVGPGAFRPPPRVDSAVVRLMPHRELPHPARNEARFAAIVLQAFTRRRKTLRNALAGLVAPAEIERSGIDPGLRPERLSVADFVRLADTPPPG